MKIQSYSAGGSHGTDLDADALPDYNGLLLEFPRELDPEESERVRGIVCYWASMPYTCNRTEVNEWISPRHFWIDANSYNSRSSDWRARDVFAELQEYLQEGTPSRKDKTRKWAGVDTAPERIVLGHPGDEAPPLPEPPLDFSREGRQPALYVPNSAYGLLQMR